MDQRGAGRGFDLGVGGVGFAEADVLGDGAGKDRRLLLDIGEAAAKIGWRDVADIDAIDEDAAAADVVEALGQREDRALAGARRRRPARRSRPCATAKLRSARHLLAVAGLVGEADILEGDGAERRYGHRDGLGAAATMPALVSRISISRSVAPETVCSEPMTSEIELNALVAIRA